MLLRSESWFRRDESGEKKRDRPAAGDVVRVVTTDFPHDPGCPESFQARSNGSDRSSRMVRPDGSPGERAACKPARGAAVCRQAASSIAKRTIGCARYLHDVSAKPMKACGQERASNACDVDRSMMKGTKRRRTSRPVPAAASPRQEIGHSSGARGLHADRSTACGPKTGRVLLKSISSNRSTGNVDQEMPRPVAFRQSGPLL